MSTIWTPSGDHQPDPGPAGDAGEAREPADAAAFREARRELGTIPAAVMVYQHTWALAEVAMIHMMPEPLADGTPVRPRPEEAKIAIDAFAALVEAVGDQLPDAADLREALQQLQLGYVDLVQALAAFDAGEAGPAGG